MVEFSDAVGADPIAFFELLATIDQFDVARRLRVVVRRDPDA